MSSDISKRDFWYIVGPNKNKRYPTVRKKASIYHVVRFSEILTPHRGQTWSFGQPPLETTWSIQDLRILLLSKIMSNIAISYIKFISTIILK